MIAPGRKENDVTFIMISGYNTTPNLSSYRLKCRSFTLASGEIEKKMKTKTNKQKTTMNVLHLKFCSNSPSTQ